MTHNARVLALLSDGKPHTHHELYALGVVAHSRVSDLRKRLRLQGRDIAHWRARDGGETVSVYQLVSLSERGVDDSVVTGSAAGTYPVRRAEGSDATAPVPVRPARSESASQLALEVA